MRSSVERPPGVGTVSLSCIEPVIGSTRAAWQEILRRQYLEQRPFEPVPVAEPRLRSGSQREYARPSRRQQPLRGDPQRDDEKDRYLSEAARRLEIDAVNDERQLSIATNSRNRPIRDIRQTRRIARSRRSRRPRSPGA